MKKDFVIPIVALTLICLIISAALAVTNNFTAPVITKAAADRASQARSEVIPEAAGFTPVQVGGLPATVREVYKTTNQKGFIFMLTAGGYGGDIDIICGITPDGKIIEVKVLRQTETKGMGSKITEEPFAGQFPGKDRSLAGVNTITGATISSKAYVNAVKDAFTAFELVKGVQ